MVDRWRALPPPTRMWVVGGLVWFPLILLELVLGILVGGTRAWTPIFVSLIVIGRRDGRNVLGAGCDAGSPAGPCQAPAEHVGLVARTWSALSSS
jgi:hypothetical protein